MTDRGTIASESETTLGPRDRLAFLLVFVPYAALVRHFWFVADDAYISFRYSRNWGSGLGLVFNPGESPPAEGYSNFLMVAVGALVQRLGGDLELWLPLLCAVSGAVLLALVFRTLRLRLGVGLLPASLATAFLGWSAPFAVWSTSGLEAMPYSLLFTATVVRLFTRSGSVALTGVLAILLAMTRVEGIAWALLVFPALSVLSRRLAGEPVGGALLRYVAIVAVGYGVYFAARFSYFGHAFPMTVYAKVGFTLDRTLRGVDYLALQTMTSLSLLALVPGAFAALRADRRALGIPLALVPIGVAVYTVLVGGDWMTFSRFLLPGLPALALLVGWFLVDLFALGAAVGGAVGSVLVALAVLPGFDVHMVPESTRERFHFRLNTPSYRSEWAQWEFQRWNGIRWSAKGNALRALDTPDASVVMGAIGAASYVSDLFTLDRHGFVTPVVALRELDEREAGLRSPGHDKVVDERWFVDRGHDPVYLRAKLYDARTRDDLLRLFERSKRRLRTTGLADRYVADFAKLSDEPDPEGVDWYLFLWTRIPAGTSSEQAWADLEQREQRFGDEGVVRVLGVAPPDERRVPGLPSWM